MINETDKVFSRLVGPMSVWKEYKPRKDAVEYTAYFWMDNEKWRVDHEVVSESYPGHLTIDEQKRFAAYELDKTIRKSIEDGSLRTATGFYND